jgi:hypothetical protein
MLNEPRKEDEKAGLDDIPCSCIHIPKTQVVHKLPNQTWIEELRLL